MTLTFAQEHVLAEKEASKQSSNAALREINKQLRDPFNRLHSISRDSAYVSSVLHTLGDIPVVANLRCGAWYLDPNHPSVVHERAYFKSTDGHTGQWGFNLRRANLQLVGLIAERGGLIITDSTRRGKRFPDALSKTIPLWCAVLNQAVLHFKPHLAQQTTQWQDLAQLQLPSVIPPSEAQQMRARLDPCTRSLLHSSYPLEAILSVLDKPLHPIFASPATPSDQLRSRIDAIKASCLPIVCLSTSCCPDDNNQPLDRFYVQGAADDEESWARGLTAPMFWASQRELLDCPQDDLEELIGRVVAKADEERQAKHARLYGVNERLSLYIEPVEPAACTLCFSRDAAAASESRYAFGLPSFKKGKNAMDDCLQQLGRRVGELEVDSVVIGFDSTVAASEGVDWAVAACLLVLARSVDHNNINKGHIAGKLHQVINATEGRANPSRLILKRVNEHLMSPSRGPQR